MMSPALRHYLECDADLRAHMARHPELSEDSELEESHLVDHLEAAEGSLSPQERSALDEILRYRQ